MALHELALDASVLHGCFSRDLEPALTVEPGDSVRFSTPNAGWNVGRDEAFARPDPERDTGHALAGPIEVRGSRAGQVLAVTVDEVVPGPWGATFADETRLDWELENGVGRAAGRAVRLAPFLGELVPTLEAEGALRLEPAVRERLLAMSGATIDRRNPVPSAVLHVHRLIDRAVDVEHEVHAEPAALQHVGAKR